MTEEDYNEQRRIVVEKFHEKVVKALIAAFPNTQLERDLTEAFNEVVEFCNMTGYEIAND